jgi:hypothetical protein
MEFYKREKTGGEWGKWSGGEGMGGGDSFMKMMMIFR